MAEPSNLLTRAISAIQDVAANDYFKSDSFQRMQSAAKIGLLVGVFVYLIWRLTDIGWGAVLTSLPATPLFYLIFAVRYSVLPVTELIIYQRLWSRKLSGYLPVFFRKRVFNMGVLDYSGEAYFLVWARQTLNLGDKEIFNAIRDSNILSAVSSNLLTILFLLIFVWMGLGDTLSASTENAWLYLFAAGFIAIFLTAIIVTFRRHLIGVPFSEASWLLGVHSGRMLTIMLLMGAQWASALPEVPWSVWWMFLTAHLVLNRLPLLPNKDLMFLGLSVGLTGYVDGPEAALAAVFVASSALTQLAHLATFSATSSLGDGAKPPKDPENS